MRNRCYYTTTTIITRTATCAPHGSYGLKKVQFVCLCICF